MPKLYNGYVVSQRVYFLVSKTHNNYVDGYFYKNFMNYRTSIQFIGNITNKKQFLINYIDNSDPLADEKFVKTKYIPNKEYLQLFTPSEQQIIYDKVGNIFNVICEHMSDDILCYNDDKKSNSLIGFHIYGADILINDQMNVKLLEINGAPAMNVKSRYYGLYDRLDYFDLMEEVFQKVIDPIFPPSEDYKLLVLDAFEKVFSKDRCCTQEYNEKPLFYV
jgi:hypothetical protein